MTLYVLYYFHTDLHMIGIFPNEVRKANKLLSANYISALCPVDQWECSHFLVHNLFAFLRTFPWLNCMLKNVIILIGPLAELYIREQTLAFCRKVRAKGLKQLATHFWILFAIVSSYIIKSKFSLLCIILWQTEDLIGCQE